MSPDCFRLWPFGRLGKGCALLRRVRLLMDSGVGSTLADRLALVGFVGVAGFGTAGDANEGPKAPF